MIEFLKKFLASIDLGRQARSPKSVLRDLEELVRQAGPEEEFTFEYLLGKLSPPTVEELATALAFLVQHGLLKQRVRVESPTAHGGIHDYESIQEVPDEIYDWHSDEEITVRPEYLRIVYMPVWEDKIKKTSPSLALR